MAMTCSVYLNSQLHATLRKLQNFMLQTATEMLDQHQHKLPSIKTAQHVRPTCNNPQPHHSPYALPGILQADGQSVHTNHVCWLCYNTCCFAKLLKVLASTVITTSAYTASLRHWLARSFSKSSAHVMLPLKPSV